MFSNLLFRLRALNEDIEFVSILIFLVFFPEKSSFYYFMLFAVLMITFLIRKIIISKNIGISNFTRALLVVNFLLLISTLFSVYFLKSILFFFDLFLISAYFILHLIEEREVDRNIKLFGSIISVYSLIFLIVYVFFGSRDLFFSNPIMSGITSGAGVLIFLYYFLTTKNYAQLLLIGINLTALFISESKAAFLGVAVFSLLLVLLKKRKAVPVVLVLILLTFIIPNPVRTMFEFSIYKDPYSADRLKIWDMGIKIFRDNVFTGTGADNFSEIAKKYNFRQVHGPANYYKVPRTPHSDYIKLLAELGIWGVFILVFSLYFILKRIAYGPLFDISKILILYLLFQALFFNIIFQTFFFFLFIFLLKTLFKGEIDFHTNTRFMRFISILLLMIVIFIGYIFPYYSDLMIGRSSEKKDLSSIFDTLDRAERFNRMNVNPFYFRSTILLGQFKRTSDPVYLYAALDNVRKIYRINPYYDKAYFLESDIHRSILEKGMHYPGLLEEIITPLRRLEEIDPFNPFINMEKADLFIKFKQYGPAKAEALRALELEPDYIYAHYFLQQHFNYFGDDGVYLKKIGAILDKTADWAKRDIPYLNALVKVPDDMAGVPDNGGRVSD